MQNYTEDLNWISPQTVFLVYVELRDTQNLTGE